MKYFAMLAATMMASCVGAQPRVRESMAEGNLVSVAAGTFRGGGVVVAGTYVIDPSTNLCFFSADVVVGGTVGPVGIVGVDCCRLRKIPEVLAAVPSLGETCVDPAPGSPGPASQPAPRS